ncbi:MAG: HDIG domain-containing protein [PVC group bacterium]|nr:HDIG domain-containing protein [PVC group bacterium]
MEKNKDNKKQGNKTRSIIQIIITISLCLLVLIIVFVGKDSFLPTNYLTHGEICQRDMYSPFDYKFVDIDGQTIEIKKKELISRRGERITKTQELAFQELQGLQKQPKRLYYLLGIFLLFIIFSAITATYLNVHAPKIIFKIKNIVLLCLVTLLIIAGTKGILLSSWSVYLIPLASVSMLVAMLLDPGVAFMLTVILSVLIGALTGLRLDVAGTMLAGGIIGIYSVLNVRRRRDLTKAGLLVGLTNMVSIVALGLISFIPIADLIVESAWGLANGIICAIIATSILPILEIMFGITTNISLLELSDLNQPLLKEMVLKAPGTYHHSLVVGNLAESAAEAVGANNLLARVGAYFHDIGKLRMAPYFSENQSRAENKHENLSPTISSLIIINHIKEGADLAKKHKLGRTIIDIIKQHHGDDVVYYFYHRALEQHAEDKGKVLPEDFRYPGPKPQSKEAAIVMLADSVEAASKAMQQPTPAKMKEMVNRIINNKFIDGQLDGCDLTLKDLHIISEVFIHILNGIFHTRVEYPNLNLEANEQNNNKEFAEKEDKSSKAEETSKPDTQTPGD